MSFDGKFVMKKSESKLKEENEIITELFNFDGDETRLKHLKEIFTNFIAKSEHDLNYFILFLQYYSKHRPHQRHVSKELVECIYSCFSEEIEEIKQNIKKKDILKFIIFPEEFHMKRTKRNVFTSSKR